jgi:hypothetical protein
MTGTQQRAELQRRIWQIANDGRFASAGVLAPENMKFFSYLKNGLPKNQDSFSLIG